MFLLVPAYPGCPGSKAVKRSLLLLLLLVCCRITAVCGAYYIGGREFDSLSDLIGYYTSYSDLLKGERLQTPVPPPEVCMSLLFIHLEKRVYICSVVVNDISVSGIDLFLHYVKNS